MDTTPVAASTKDSTSSTPSSSYITLTSPSLPTSSLVHRSRIERPPPPPADADDDGDDLVAIRSSSVVRKATKAGAAASAVQSSASWNMALKKISKLMYCAICCEVSSCWNSLASISPEPSPSTVSNSLRTWCGASTTTTATISRFVTHL
jgi:hypothetical protein